MIGGTQLSRFTYHMDHGQTGAITKILLQNPNLLVDGAIPVFDVLQIFEENADLRGCGITDAQRLCSLAIKGVFLPEEILPIILTCKDMAGIFKFKQEFPGNISDEEILQMVDIRQCILRRSNSQGLSTKRKLILRESRKIKGLQELINTHELLNS